MAEKEKLTMAILSGDMERALAAFMLAITGVSMGMEVNMFFTFWGLNIIKKNEGGIQGRGLMRKMLNLMNRGGSRRLKLSRFNMFGLGTWMMKKLMKDTNMPSVDEYITMAHEMGVNLIGCTTTCGVMGIAPEEKTFRSEVENLSGATYFLNLARQSKVVLFI
ncbi:MAG: DsrE/DsrF/DrsH-like family protein [Chloroflexi bacterium]|nr:DsrE/DsrF/DrsH-like family protein [Chloroflexota bacterium]MBI3931156.1 DsrE/DsrF/DrsH-like family protein [Chloroflexota bacterium]